MRVAGITTAYNFCRSRRCAGIRGNTTMTAMLIGVQQAVVLRGREVTAYSKRMGDTVPR
jgi:hypothetical protein